MDNKTIDTLAAVKTVINQLDIEIRHLALVKGQLVALYGLDLEPTPVSPVLKTPSSKKRGRPAKVHGPLGLRLSEVVLDILAAGPLGPVQILAIAQARGWQTTSKKPISLVYSMLQTLAHKGLIEKLGLGAWQLTKTADVPVTEPQRADNIEQVA